MRDEDILRRIKRYFKIYELVGKETYEVHGERAWRFLDTRLLRALLIVREGLGKGIIANNWHGGGRFDERGLRTNVQGIFKGYFKKKKLYLSAHVMGKAVDFDVIGMKAEAVREWIVMNQGRFPFKIRLENNVNWVHIDVIHEDKNPKVYLFDV